MREAQLGRMLLGRDRNDEPGRTTTYYGVALADSADGAVRVSGSWQVVAQDGDEGVLIPCTAQVREGELVPVTVVNGAPMAGAPVGWGDRVAAVLAAQAKSLEGVQQDADDAAKVATNYMGLKDVGLVIGNLIAETLGLNTLMGADGFYVRKGETDLAAYKEKLIDLGMNALDAVIRMCKGALEITAEKDASFSNATHGKIAATGGDSVGSLSVRTHSNYADAWIEANEGDGKLVHAGSYAEKNIDYTSFGSEARSNATNSQGTALTRQSQVGLNGTAGPTGAGVGLTTYFMSGSSSHRASISAMSDSSSGTITALADTVTVMLGSTSLTLKAVYRAYNANAQDHYYMTDKAEYDALGPDWIKEDVAFYALVP